MLINLSFFFDDDERQRNAVLTAWSGTVEGKVVGIRLSALSGNLAGLVGWVC